VRKLKSDTRPGVCCRTMNKKSVSVGFLFVCLIFSGVSILLNATTQTEQTTGKLTMEQLTTAAKHFFRDTAEFPLLQKMTMTVTDSSGRVIKTRNLSVDYVFRGFSPRTKSTLGNVHAEVSFWDAIGGAKILKVAMNSDIWTMVAGDELVSDSGQNEMVASSNLPANHDGARQEFITAKLLPAKPCPAVTMKHHPDDYMTDLTCGASEFQLKDDLSFQKFSFEVTGLPAPVNVSPLGQCTLQRYHAEIEFQSVTVAGEKEPFIVPKKVTASLETNKGKILIVSEYEPKARMQ
jgi:hypothetical protein